MNKPIQQFRRWLVMCLTMMLVVTGVLLKHCLRLRHWVLIGIRRRVLLCLSSIYRIRQW